MAQFASYLRRPMGRPVAVRRRRASRATDVLVEDGTRRVGQVELTARHLVGHTIDDVETKIFHALPDETWVYPGHGQDTSLGAERPQLPEWHARGW